MLRLAGRLADRRLQPFDGGLELGHPRDALIQLRVLHRHFLRRGHVRRGDGRLGGGELRRRRFLGRRLLRLEGFQLRRESSAQRLRLGVLGGERGAQVGGFRLGVRPRTLRRVGQPPRRLLRRHEVALGRGERAARLLEDSLQRLLLALKRRARRGELLLEPRALSLRGGAERGRLCFETGPGLLRRRAERSHRRLQLGLVAERRLEGRFGVRQARGHRLALDDRLLRLLLCLLALGDSLLQLLLGCLRALCGGRPLGGELALEPRLVLRGGRFEGVFLGDGRLQPRRHRLARGGGFLRAALVLRRGLFRRLQRRRQRRTLSFSLGAVLLRLFALFHSLLELLLRLARARLRELRRRLRRLSARLRLGGDRLRARRLFRRGARVRARRLERLRGSRKAGFQTLDALGERARFPARRFQRRRRPPRLGGVRLGGVLGLALGGAQPRRLRLALLLHRAQRGELAAQPRDLGVLGAQAVAELELAVHRRLAPRGGGERRARDIAVAPGGGRGRARGVRVAGVRAWRPVSRGGVRGEVLRRGYVGARGGEFVRELPASHDGLLPALVEPAALAVVRRVMRRASVGLVPQHRRQARLQSVLVLVPGQIRRGFRTRGRGGGTARGRLVGRLGDHIVVQLRAKRRALRLLLALVLLELLLAAGEVPRFAVHRASRLDRRRAHARGSGRARREPDMVGTPENTRHGSNVRFGLSSLPLSPTSRDPSERERTTSGRFLPKPTYRSTCILVFKISRKMSNRINVSRKHPGNLTYT